MFPFITPDRVADLFYAGGDRRVLRALEDLSRDAERVCGRRACVKPYAPAEDDGGYAVFLLDETLTDRPERYRIEVTRDRVTVTAGEFRGLLWGIYTLSEDYLGVDPAIRFSRIRPERRAAVGFPEGVRDDAPHFRFRGWFINDEDLLTKWKEGGGERRIDYPYYHEVTAPEALDAVLETALRMKINLIIPASFIDIRNPAEERLVRMAADRGLYVSQHHVEPLGTSYFGYENYWRDRGREVTACYSQQKEMFEEVWRDSARRWAKYDGVIWQLGLRGRADRPLWASDASAPATDAERGRVIGEAMAKQAEIVSEAVGGRPFLSSTTLWAEGSALYAGGHLTIPQGTTVVFADAGHTQMLCEDFFSVPREAGRKRGVYYHIAFWSAGPHLAQANDPRKMAWNYREAIRRGDDEYSILNVSSVREFLFGAAANAALVWAPDRFDADRFTRDWTERHWGAGTAPLLRAYFDAFPERPGAKDDFFNAADFGGALPFPEAVLMDGVTRSEGLRLLGALAKGNEDGARQIAGAVRPLLETGLTAFRDVLRRAERVAVDSLDGDRRRYFDESLVLQTETMLALYEWLYELTGAVGLPAGPDRAAALDRAAAVLERHLRDRRRAETGEFAHWFRGDDKMNLPGLLTRTRAAQT